MCVLVAGPLPKHNNVTWRGNSGMRDGISDLGAKKNLVGGYYDAGDAIKFNFPMAYSMTLLSWSVIEYSAKYEAAGELDHVKEIIKWGADYLLKTFNSSADTIDSLVAQVRITQITDPRSPTFLISGLIFRRLDQEPLERAKIPQTIIIAGRDQKIWITHDQYTNAARVQI